MAQKIIGKVAALENNPSTIDHFYFWTDKDTLLNPFDVVVVEHVRGSKTYGVVEEISHITDSESFLGEYFSNDFGSLDVVPNTERVGMNFVLARVVKNTQNISRGSYMFVPLQDFSKPWTDEELYAKYGLTEEEIAFIESMIRPME